jgi:hypothetical protein
VAPFEFKPLAKSRLIDWESQVFSAVYTFMVFEIMLHSFAWSACTVSVIERVEVAMGDCMYFRQQPFMAVQALIGSILGGNWMAAACR